MSSSPPGYSASHNGPYDAYPQPHNQSQSKPARPGSVRHRKSSTIIPICQEEAPSPSISPAVSTALLPEFATYDNSTRSSFAPKHSLGDRLGGSARPKQDHAPLERMSSNSSSAAEEGEATPLLGDEAVPGKWYEGPMFTAGVKLAVLFMCFTVLVAGTFYFGMPKLDPEDKQYIKLPRSFADLQALNGLFQKYKRENPFRLLACGVVSYLFVQTFSLPGSMYISILFGAAYGIIYGLLLSCLCDACGSVFCYALSSIVAPPLLALPFYRARVETWRVKIMGDPKKGKQVSWGDVFAFLVVLRISPFPPHWVANFVAPHLGIGVPLFWLSCFVGIAPVSVIHVTIGSSLDTMTSAADFHILSVRNVLGLIAVVVAVLIPVGLKRVFKKDLGELEEAEAVIEEVSPDTVSIDVPGVEGSTRRYQAVDSGVILAGPSRGDDNLDTGSKRKGKGRALAIIADVDEDGDESAAGEDEEIFYTQPAAMVRNEKRPMGYGAIERVQPERVVTGGPAPWWPFAR